MTQNQAIVSKAAFLKEADDLLQQAVSMQRELEGLYASKYVCLLRCAELSVIGSSVVQTETFQCKGCQHHLPSRHVPLHVQGQVYIATHVNAFQTCNLSLAHG